MLLLLLTACSINMPNSNVSSQISVFLMGRAKLLWRAPAIPGIVGFSFSAILPKKLLTVAPKLKMATLIRARGMAQACSLAMAQGEEAHLREAMKIIRQ
jgi:hypothetical protein